MVSLSALKKAIVASWSRETCHFNFLWDDISLPDSAGHCRVTALIVQDYCGGDILYTYVKGNRKWDHYYNKLSSGKIVDLTRDQFPENAVFISPQKISRSKVLSSNRTKKGYFLLKKKVDNFLTK